MMFQRLIDGLNQRLNTLITRCVLEGLQQSDSHQVVKISGIQSMPNLEALQPGGLAHTPIEGAEGLLIRFGGGGSHGVVLLLANRERPDTRPGEAGLYTVGPNAGMKILCKDDGSVEITPSVGQKVVIKGALEVDQEITWNAATAPTKASTHVHPGPFPVGPPTPGS